MDFGPKAKERLEMLPPIEQTLNMDNDASYFNAQLPDDLKLNENAVLDFNCVVNDNPVEDLILENPDLMDAYVNDIKSFNVREFDRKVLNNETLAKFDNLYPNLRNSARRNMIKRFLEEHPSMTTMDPQILYQRINYFYSGYKHKAERYPNRRFNTVSQRFQAMKEADGE